MFYLKDFIYRIYFEIHRTLHVNVLENFAFDISQTRDNFNVFLLITFKDDYILLVYFSFFFREIILCMI